MEYELNDQDRADIVINFLKKYAVWIILALALISAGFGIHTYMQQRIASQNQNASIAYQAILNSIQNNASADEITASANTLIQDYPSSVYASFSRLMLANIAVQQNNLNNAESILKQVLKQNQNNSLSPIIKLRLARVLISANKPADAIRLLENPPKGFASSFALLTGDAELLQHNQAGAKATYLAAQQANQTENDPVLNQLLTERLNNLGSTS